MESDRKQQELIYKLALFEQQIQQVQQQIQAIERGIFELSSLNYGLDELIGATDKEVMAQIGRGIFVKSKILSEELLVDVGEKIFVKKSVPETQRMIGEQIEKLKDAKEELQDNLEGIEKEFERIF